MSLSFALTYANYEDCLSTQGVLYLTTRSILLYQLISPLFFIMTYEV